MAGNVGVDLGKDQKIVGRRRSQQVSGVRIWLRRFMEKFGRLAVGKGPGKGCSM